MIFIVISHFPLIMSNALGSPVFIHKFLKIVYILCPDSNLLHQSILLKVSQMESFIQTNKQTQDFLFNFSGIHFYTCIQWTEKTAVALCGSLQVTVQPASAPHQGSPAAWVSFLHPCFYIVQCDVSSLSQNRNDLFSYQTWTRGMDLNWVRVKECFPPKQHSAYPRGKRLMSWGKLRNLMKSFLLTKISLLAVGSVTCIIFFLISFTIWEIW